MPDISLNRGPVSNSVPSCLDDEFVFPALLLAVTESHDLFDPNPSSSTIESWIKI